MLENGLFSKLLGSRNFSPRHSFFGENRKLAECFSNESRVVDRSFRVALADWSRLLHVVTWVSGSWERASFLKDTARLDSTE